ncbi:hypothetical protein Tco_0116538 [Tanacetum coccineum]
MSAKTEALILLLIYSELFKFCASKGIGFPVARASRLCTCSAKLHDISEAVLVRSGLSSVWLNRKCDPVFRRKDDNIGRVGDDAQMVEEPHEFFNSTLQRVENHSTSPVVEDTPLPKPTPKEIVNDLSEASYTSYLESSLDKDEDYDGTSTTHDVTSSLIGDAGQGTTLVGATERARMDSSVAEVPSASALQVLRRLGSIFTSVYAVV